MSDAMLQVEGLVSGYDGVPVLHGLDFAVTNEVFAVLGANGAGKTTLLATLARLIPVMKGSIHLLGDDITKMPAHESSRRGIGYVPQERGVFADLTVAENLEVGSMVSGRPLEHQLAHVFDIFPDLHAKRHLRGGTLSGGESRMVACGRALMQSPSVLLLDEPTAGLAPKYVDLFFEKIVEIHRSDSLAIVLAEQNATKALEVADRVLVLSLGEAHDVMDAADLTTEQLKKAYRI